MKQKVIVKNESVDIDSIKINPKNPRVVKDAAFKELKKSIEDFPEMMEVSRVKVDERGIIFAGEKRYLAICALGWKKVPIMRMIGLTPKQKNKFMIKDNNHAGDWDWNKLAEWDMEELKDWGLSISIEKKNGKVAAVKTEYYINIACKNEKHANQLYERFIGEGLEVKIVT